MTEIVSRPPLTSEQFREILIYEPDTGNLIWRNRPNLRKGWNTAFAGKIVGYRNDDGYLKMLANGRTFLCHRVIWSMVHGSWPSTTIDHINGVRDDNRIENLRLATISQNAQNQKNKRPLMPDGSPGLKGANFQKKSGRWCGRIKANGHFCYLGMFGTAEEAHQAYVRAGADLHGQFAQPS